MTVLTKVKVSKLEDEPVLTQLVTGSGEAEDDSQVPASVDEVDAEAVQYQLLHQRARRINGSNLCALIALIAVIALCLLCGLFYYRHRVIYQNGRVHAWCSIPYEGETNNVDLLEGSPPEPELLGRQPEARIGQAARLENTFNLQQLPQFHEQFDIDMEESTEQLFTPHFADNEGARFIADFKLNKLALLPTESPHCMIMDLDRDDFMEPQALAVQVQRMERGEMLPEALTVTRRTLVMVSPERQRRDAFGAFELRACLGRPHIFAMRTVSVTKRSVGEPLAAKKFSVFGGRGLIQYTVQQLPRLD